MEKQYQHNEVESRIYKSWEDAGAFSAKVDPAKPAFCVVIPPPNITGILHMGHVLDNIPQDVMTRWHRMRGFEAVWIPGTDHAGIATQNVVKRQLDKEGIDYRSLGREEFIKRVWAWKDKHGSIITNQLKRLGCSCDWERERFTMDQGLSKAVLQAFVHYFNKGLVYRGKRMIHWCTVCGTALADDEVEYEPKNGQIWHLKYPVLTKDGKESGEFLVLATTRPETMLGDTAVAVHPADQRYTQMVGGFVKLPLQDRKIPIIADDFVDPKFGTGVVKITPAHDPNDYQAGLRHKLDVEVVVGFDGKMTAAAGSFVGLDRYVARKEVVKALEKLELVDKIEQHSNAVGECYRCKTVVEPMVSDQWFVRMQPLAEQAKKAVVDGRLRIVPESEKHDYFHWMDTIQDWCISRQLWWGHRIPVYYCEDCGHMNAALETPTKCEKCSCTKLKQDEDVLDTWFSSQLWPFSTLGWPEQTKELKYWYPNNWLMSGRDILFFWDARMIMAGLELLGEVPFKTLTLHGLVRDDKGRKLSKSLGNSPDPLGLFDQYGTDAVRAAIMLHYPMGRNDTRLRDEIYRNGQGLVIKLWNASRLLLMNIEGQALSYDRKSLGRSYPEDRWIISRLSKVIELHDKMLSESDLVHSLDSLTTFFWNEYCDWYLEIIKPRLRKGGEEMLQALRVAFLCHKTLLKLFHPYLPFVTEELWQVLEKQGVVEAGTNEPMLIRAAWPKPAELARSEETEEAFSVTQSIVRSVRDVRHQLNLPPKEALTVKLQFNAPKFEQEFTPLTEIAKGIGAIGDLQIVKAITSEKGWVPYKFEAGIAFVKLPDNLDLTALAQRIAKKLTELEASLAGTNKRLANQEFVQNAPPEIVSQAKAQAGEIANAIEKLQGFQGSLA